MTSTYLAADFGGGSGRIIAGTIKPATGGKQLVMTEIHRFPNRTVRINGYLYWDFPALFAELKAGLAKAASMFGDIVSIGIDTWGVDFGLVDRLGNLIANPMCYRDGHTAGLPEKFAENHDMEEHYKITGIQVLGINTLFRLMSMAEKDDPKLAIADRLLFMPDLFSYFLTGKGGNEYTIASTSELLDASTRDWDRSLIESIGVNPDLFGPILMPGSIRGEILPEIAEETGLPGNVKVVAVGSHDTASAVFGASLEHADADCAFLSSGTWSLLGVELGEPILTDAARKADYTNEGGVGGTVTFLTNITGLWILQKLKEGWERQGIKISWGELISEAEGSRDTSVIDVDDPIFQNPDDMVGNITRYCKEHNLEVPANRGEMVRCACVSLAVRYKRAIENLNSLLPTPVKKIRIFGGGSNNDFLNRLTAKITGLEVVKGPTEATAIGNLLVQALAHGTINEKSEISEIIET